ncbi:hypothetical protein [Tychonema sp. LEGE 06208]|uniref:hypothetical protein n=1 Tax=Tychonema sp. LEGE 06208 TaxID=1828663 RepID=UPI00187F51D2|nr:hypothetical protein [Tychonema sp. LEGE 06208]MBE9164186.1 hypothetical protein [Tychonema sp. LEGE 06208]
MTNITAGTGATITATTIEGQFLQLIEYFQALESAAGNTTNFFAGTYDSDTLTFTGNFQVPIKSGDSLSLNFVGDPDAASFPSGTFSAGTTGTFTAPLAIDYFIQVVNRLISTQNDLAKNPTKLENISATLNLNRKQLSGNFSVPYTKAATSTGISINAATYLL